MDDMDAFERQVAGFKAELAFVMAFAMASDAVEFEDRLDIFGEIDRAAEIHRRRFDLPFDRLVLSQRPTAAEQHSAAERYRE